MEKRDWTWVYANKANTVKDIMHIINSFDDETDVASMEYSRNQDTRSEYVNINYFDGTQARICVSMNSEGSIFREIMRELYGEGAVGGQKRHENSSK